MQRSAALLFALIIACAAAPIGANGANTTDPGNAYAGFSRVGGTGTTRSVDFTNRAKLAATAVRAEIDFFDEAGAPIGAAPVSASGTFASGSTTHTALTAELPALAPSWASASARLDGVDYAGG